MRYKSLRGTYYKSCPACGANLDPGEHCDCSVPHMETKEQ